jgi:phenylpropionate dioxygenase-like ring-hydroxylating dioxygenase large terminal subunit
MEAATQIRLINQVHEYESNGTTCLADKEYFNPVERYTDPAWLEDEVRHIFRRAPLLLAHSSELAKPGDFKTVEVTGVQVLLVRDMSGQVNAFLNVCRHRGTKLVWQECGEKKRSFACPYHGWTYGTDGRLMRLPNAEAFPSVDPDKTGLVRLHARECAGMIFVQIAPDAPAMDIDAWLGEVGRDFARFGIAQYNAFSPSSEVRPYNWKLTMDLFQENYHTRMTHTDTIWKLFLDNTAVFERFAPHIRSVIPKRSILDLRGTDSADWNLRAHATLLYTVFPNTMVAVLVDHAAIFQVFPQDAAHTRVRTTILVPKIPTSEKAKAAWEKSIALVNAVTAEDSARAIAIQAGLESQANRYLTFGRFEQGLGWFHEQVASAVDARRPMVAAAE